MLNQFSRSELVFGKNYTDKLNDKVVAVFGLGGVGGNVCDALARSGITSFVLIDNDKVSLTNINRQLIANLNTIGRNKVDVMEEHLKSINKDIKVIKHCVFYLPGNADQFDFSKYDYVVDAIDTVSAKIDIISKCKSIGTPVISSLGCGNKVDPTKLQITDLSKTSYDPLAKVMRYELRKRNINHVKVVCSNEQPVEVDQELLEKALQLEDSKKKSIPGSTAFVPPVAGILIASEVIKDLVTCSHHL